MRELIERLEGLSEATFKDFVKRFEKRLYQLWQGIMAERPF